MINQLITWLRRDDQMLEPLRREIQQQERQVNWENLQKAIIFILIGSATTGFGVMLAMWIA